MPQRLPQTELITLISSLDAEQQDAVAAFVRYLQQKSSHSSKIDVRRAMDEFIREHSELLQRLAQ